MEDQDFGTIFLYDEDGEEVEFEVVTKLDIEGKEYVIVTPMDEDTEDAIALRIDKDEDGNEVLVTVEDDEEFELIEETYETLFAEDLLN
ncbi:MAG TPA: DUF1292 domain-containing protein [Clostridiaceae bacterium]|nr:DUF1292 domain-containing protein [Clostridiaceae bacterium]